jgi:hypothetical protein
MASVASVTQCETRSLPTSFTSFVGHSRARGPSELGLQVDPPVPPRRRADRLARGSLRLPPTSPISVSPPSWRARDGARAFGARDHETGAGRELPGLLRQHPVRRSLRLSRPR